VGCLQLINAIVSNADDLEFRHHLRNEIMRAGLIDILEVNAVERYEYISVLVNMFLNVYSGLNLDHIPAGDAVCQI
jgi:diaphanous 2